MACLTHNLGRICCALPSQNSLGIIYSTANYNYQYYLSNGSALPLCANIVYKFLGGIFNIRVGKEVWKARPARFVDLTFFDFYCCDYVKQRVYGFHIINVEHLKGRIIETLRLVTYDVLSYLWENWSVI